MDRKWSKMDKKNDKKWTEMDKKIDKYIWKKMAKNDRKVN